MQIALIGPNDSTCTTEIYAFGESLGLALADRGHHLICGGKGGFMEALAKGAQQSRRSDRGRCIGIIPESDAAVANPYCDVVIPTGMGLTRNSLVVASGEVVIAVGGGAGTLSELAYAWQFGKRVLCMTGFGGWSERLAGQQLDHRKAGLLVSVSNLDEILIALQDAA